MKLSDRASGAGAPFRGVWASMLGLTAAAAGLVGSASSPLYAQHTVVSSGHGAEAKDMRLLGHHDLQARSAYQPVIHQQGARWIAYIGHHGGVAMNPLTGTQEGNGTSIVDVTDRAHPQCLSHIPGEQGIGEARGVANFPR